MQLKYSGQEFSSRGSPPSLKSERGLILIGDRFYLLHIIAPYRIHIRLYKNNNFWELQSSRTIALQRNLVDPAAATEHEDMLVADILACLARFACYGFFKTSC